MVGGVIALVWGSIVENLTLQRKATWKMLGRLGDDYGQQIQDVIREYRRKWSALTPLHIIAVKGKGWRPIEDRVIVLMVGVYLAVIIVSLILAVKGN